MVGHTNGDIFQSRRTAPATSKLPASSHWPGHHVIRTKCPENPKRQQFRKDNRQIEGPIAFAVGNLHAWICVCLARPAILWYRSSGVLLLPAWAIRCRWQHQGYAAFLSCHGPQLSVTSRRKFDYGVTSNVLKRPANSQSTDSTDSTDSEELTTRSTIQATDLDDMLHSLFFFIIYLSRF